MYLFIYWDLHEVADPRIGEDCKGLRKTQKSPIRSGVLMLITKHHKHGLKKEETSKTRIAYNQLIS